jgi:organic radical activating enzyme
MTAFNIEPQYLYKLMSMPRGMFSTEAIANRCNVPDNAISIDFQGNCFLCDCDGWLPIPVGKVSDFNSINEVFDNSAANIIRDDVLLGKYSWCAVEHCGIKQRNMLRKILTITINIDESCNLHCPSCRREPIMITSGTEFEKKLQYANKILSWIQQYDKPLHIVMSGNGDPFASAILRPIVKNFEPRADQTFTIFTNGLLIKKQVSESMPIFNSITNFKISVDAGSKDIYEDVRRPGKWELLLENFDYLSSLNKSHLVNLNFALQNKNFRDIPAFVELCQRYGFKGHIHQLDNWGTWENGVSTVADPWTIKNGTYIDHNVLATTHPNYAECQQIISESCNARNISLSTKLLHNNDRSKK